MHLLLDVIIIFVVYSYKKNKNRMIIMIEKITIFQDIDN